MSTASVEIKKIPFSTRARRLRRKLIEFSVFSGIAGLLLTGVVFTITNVYFPLQDLREMNLGAFDKLHCDSQVCDISEIANAFESKIPDYVIDKDTNFVLSADQPTADFVRFPLHRSDTAFIMRFNQPASFATPSGELWRLRSAVEQLGSRHLTIMVGYAEQASWKTALPIQSPALVDKVLDEQLSKIEAALKDNNGDLEVISAAKRIAVDGYEIVDLSNDQILAGGWYWLPVYIPRRISLPRSGWSHYRESNDLFIVRVDENKRLLAITSHYIGDLRTIGAVFVSVALFAAGLGYLVGARLLRRYFVFRDLQPQTVEEAMKSGEGFSVEFKRHLSFDAPHSVEQLLQTITAFANTNDGTLFIGIEDDGKIKGLKTQSAKEKDVFSERIYQVVRQRIKPVPLIQIGYVEIRDLVVCSIFVPRGEEPLYFLDGTILVRYGAADIKAQPEIVRQLLSSFAT